MSTHNDSPYGGRTLMIEGTDVPAVDGIRGQGDEPAFNRLHTASGEREINASSKKDLMAQIAGMMQQARTDQKMRFANVSVQEKQERFATFQAAYSDKGTEKMEVLGEVMSEEIWETLGREGFTNQILAVQNVQRGDTDRVKIRRKDVVSWQVTSDVKIQESRIRQTYVYPPEFYINCFITIEDKEIEQASGDILDEKYN